MKIKHFGGIEYANNISEFSEILQKKYGLLFFVLKAKSVVRPNTHTTDSITITLLFKVYFQKTF